MLFVSVHLAVLAYSSHIAQLAALRGSQIAATADESVEVFNAAQRGASEVVRDLGARLAHTPRIQQTTRLVGMTVELQVQGLVPFLPTHLSRTVWTAREEFVMEQDR